MPPISISDINRVVYINTRSQQCSVPCQKIHFLVEKLTSMPSFFSEDSELHTFSFWDEAVNTIEQLTHKHLCRVELALKEKRPTSALFQERARYIRLLEQLDSLRKNSLEHAIDEALTQYPDAIIAIVTS